MVLDSFLPASSIEERQHFVLFFPHYHVDGTNRSGWVPGSSPSRVETSSIIDYHDVCCQIGGQASSALWYAPVNT